LSGERTLDTVYLEIVRAGGIAKMRVGAFSSSLRSDHRAMRDAQNTPAGILSNKGSSPLPFASKKGPARGPFLLAEPEGFEPSIRFFSRITV
jgi:hypothetical protein